MTLYGDGPAALIDDHGTAERLSWTARRRSRPEPEILLVPRDGDPRREPWLAPAGYRPGLGPAALWTAARQAPVRSYLQGTPGVLPILRRMAREEGPRPAVVGLSGLGRVGGTAAALLAALPSRRSGVGTLLVHDADAANLRRWALELSAIAEWRGADRRPQVRTATLDEILEGSDAFLLAAASGVPPVGAAVDVRMVQFSPNRAIQATILERARAAGFTGLYLVASDPVDLLAQAAFHDSNAGPGGAFTGEGLAPERVAGLALGVMWARALACARERGKADAEALARRGAAYGPHTTEVLVFDDLGHPDPERCATYTGAAREGNLAIRAEGFLPFVGPAVSSLALSLPRLLAGREVLASVFLDGIYFGAPARSRGGVHPVPRRMSPWVRERLAGLYEALAGRARELALTF